MAMTSDPTRIPASTTATLRDKWGWFVALGVVMLIAGVIAMLNLFAATVVSVLYVGAMMLVAGVVQIIHAFGVKSWGRFVWWLASGILYAAAGVVAFMNPILASSVLTLLLAATLLAAGAIRIWVGFRAQIRPELGVDRRRGRRHPARRAGHRARLADQQPVHPRHLPGVRPDLPGRNADRLRPGAQATLRGDAKDGNARGGSRTRRSRRRRAYTGSVSRAP